MVFQRAFNQSKSLTPGACQHHIGLEPSYPQRILSSGECHCYYVLKAYGTTLYQSHYDA